MTPKQDLSLQSEEIILENDSFEEQNDRRSEDALDASQEASRLNKERAEDLIFNMRESDEPFWKTVADGLNTAEKRGKEEAWAEGLKAGEQFANSLWYWSAGPLSRAAHLLTDRPERPPNPYTPKPPFGEEPQ